jgi:hypothetical protein
VLADDEPMEKLVQYAFCQNTFYMNSEDAPKNDDGTAKYSTRVSAAEEETDPKADAVVGWLVDGEDPVDPYEPVTDASMYMEKYSFGDPLFKAYDYLDDGARAGMYDSVSLLLVSKEICDEGVDDEPFVLTFELHCDKEIEDEGFEWYGPIWPGKRVFLENKCARHFEYYGPLGCETTTIAGIQKLFGLVNVFVLIAGIVLTFYGGKIVDEAIAFVVFFLVAGVTIAIGNSSSDFFSGDMTPVYTWVGAGIAIGLVCGILFWCFSERYGAAVIGVMGGCILTTLLLGMLPLPTWLNVIALVIVSGGLGYLGYKYDDKIKAVGTAGCGSFMVVYGVASLLKIMPSLSSAAKGFKPVYLVPLVLWVLLFWIGWQVQRRCLGDAPSVKSSASLFGEEDDFKEAEDKPEEGENQQETQE